MNSPQKSTNAATTTTTHIETRSSSRLKRNPFSDLTNTTPSYLPKPKPKTVPEPVSDPHPAISSASCANAIDGDSASTPKSKEKIVDFCDNVDDNDKNNPNTVIQIPHPPGKTPVDSSHKSNSNKINHIQTRSGSRLKGKPLSDVTNANPSAKPELKSKPVPESQPSLDPQPATPSIVGGNAIDGDSTSTSKSKENGIDFWDNVDNNDKNNLKTFINSNSNKINHIQTRSSSRLKRKPLSDLTNTNPSSLPESVPESEPVLDPESVISSTAGREAVNGDSTSTPKSKEAFVDFCDDVDNISTVYSRRAKTRRKGKERAAEAVSALSCPPLGRTTSIGRSVSLKAYVEDLHEAFSVPSDNTRKRARYKIMPTKLQKPILPRDFVEKQKAYFAEIDAFELPEEEVSDDALE